MHDREQLSRLFYVVTQLQEQGARLMAFADQVKAALATEETAIDNLIAAGTAALANAPSADDQATILQTIANQTAEVNAATAAITPPAPAPATT